MRLNLPIFDLVADCQNILIAGMGGGFDVLCGLPIYLELQNRGYNVHLANFSFVDVVGLMHGIRLTESLVGVTSDFEGMAVYFPELYLARWFQQTRNEKVTIWCFHKTGAEPLLKNYQVLVERLGIDGILLVDGGVDSLMRGDEAQMGTVLEDGLSLHVVNRLDQIPVRLMAATAFGVEREISFAHVFENIAALANSEGFLGLCSLVKQMEVYQQYEEAVMFIQSQPFQDPSVINSSIISAVRGQFGNYHLTEKTRGSKLWISPLMPIYWFFQVPMVAEHNYILSQLMGTRTLAESLEMYATAASLIRRRSWARIPLP